MQLPDNDGSRKWFMTKDKITIVIVSSVIAVTLISVLVIMPLVEPKQIWYFISGECSNMDPEYAGICYVDDH